MVINFVDSSRGYTFGTIKLNAWLHLCWISECCNSFSL